VKAGQKRSLLKTIQKRKTAYCGHMIRGAKFELQRLILEGKIKGKKGRGRPRKKWLDDIKKWTNLKSEEIFHKARDSVLETIDLQHPIRIRN
jgi:hypothetical protein